MFLKSKEKSDHDFNKVIKYITQQNNKSNQKLLIWRLKQYLGDLKFRFRVILLQRKQKSDTFKVKL